MTSSLWSAKAAKTSAFSRFGTLAKSKLRPSSAATSSNSAGEMRRSRRASRDYFARALEIFERLGTRREAVVVFFTRQPLELVPASPYDRALYS